VSYASQAARYREMEVLSATPGQLVVMLYDHLLVSLRRARLALDGGNIEVRSAMLEKCQAVLNELLVTLDFEKGGAIAKQLSALYAFMIAELVDVGAKRDVAKLERITGMVAELRDAFAQVAGGAGPQGTSA
jgi:flagellar secretion chaperone FliS